MYPSYRQLPNGCGLNTFLMLINPDKHTDYKRVLFNLYDEIDFITKQIKNFHKRLDEYKWAISLNYLLLKVLGENRLSKFLRGEYSDEFENYKLVSLFELKKNLKKKLRRLSDSQRQKAISFFDNFLINPLVFTANLYEMRTNLDLKMLFSLFGGESITIPQYNKDGTGAIFFERSDFQGDSSVAEEKIKLLKDHLRNTSDSQIHCITLNRGYHWTPVRSLDNLSTRHVSSSYRYYLYKYNPDKAYILKPEVSEFLKSEIKKERSYYKNVV